MKRLVKIGLLMALLLGVGYGAWLILFPRPEAVIRKHLLEMAKLASFSPNDGALAKLSNAQKLSNLCGDDVEIIVGIPGYQQAINGRNSVREAALMARSAVSSLRVELPDIDVKVAPDKQTAKANITARLRIGGEKDDDLRELSCRFMLIDGEWLLTRVETVKTLRN